MFMVNRVVWTHGLSPQIFRPKRQPWSFQPHLLQRMLDCIDRQPRGKTDSLELGRKTTK